MVLEWVCFRRSNVEGRNLLIFCLGTSRTVHRHWGPACCGLRLVAPGRGTGYNGGSTGLYTVHVKARKDGHGASSGKHKAAGGLVH